MNGLDRISRPTVWSAERSVNRTNNHLIEYSSDKGKHFKVLRFDINPHSKEPNQYDQQTAESIVLTLYEIKDEINNKDWPLNDKTFEPIVSYSMNYEFRVMKIEKPSEKSILEQRRSGKF